MICFSMDHLLAEAVALALDGSNQGISRLISNVFAQAGNLGVQFDLAGRGAVEVGPNMFTQGQAFNDFALVIEEKAEYFEAVLAERKAFALEQHDAIIVFHLDTGFSLGWVSDAGVTSISPHMAVASMEAAKRACR